MSANIGALQVSGQVNGLANADGTLQPLLQASVSLGLIHDAQGRTTLSTLLNTSPASLFVVTASGSLGLDIPITASLKVAHGTYDFTMGGQPEVTIVDNNLFTTPPSISYTHFDTLLSFQNLSAASLLLALDQLSAYLAEFANSPAFNTPIPFTQGTTLGSLVNVAFAYANQLSGLTAPSGAPAFSSVQQLEQVDATTSNEPISFNFVPSFQTSTGATVPALELTFNFNQSVGGSTNGGITGDNLDPVIDDSTPLADLNGGQGVQFSTTGGPDLSIALANGTVFPVTFQNPKTIGDVIAQIGEAPGNDGQLTAAINADGNGLVLTDLTLGSSLFNVIGQQGSGAALGLGLVGIGFGNPTLDPSTPISHLNNGAGVSFSTAHGPAPTSEVTLSNGTVLPITFTSPTTIADLISQVAAAPGNDGQLTLGFNAAGTGLALYDSSGGRLPNPDGTGRRRLDGGRRPWPPGDWVCRGGDHLEHPDHAAQRRARRQRFSPPPGLRSDLTVTFADGTERLDISFADPVTVGDLINLRSTTLPSVITAATPIAQLNGGKGVRFSTTAGVFDLNVTFAGGSSRWPFRFSNPQTVAAHCHQSDQ